MKKVFTAMGSFKIAYQMIKSGLFKVVTKDVPYTEGIIEVLNENMDVDTIIINELLPGEMSFKEVICAILALKSNIEIVVFVEEKTQELQNFLYSNGIYKIFQNNEVDFDTLVKSIIGEVEQTPKVLNEKEQALERVNKIITEAYIMPQISFEKVCKVISITGSYNSGKSVMTCLYGREFSKKGKKTLIIDFDVYNANIGFMLDQIPRYVYNKPATDLKAQTLHICENLDAICVMDLLFNDKVEVECMNLEKTIENLKYDYDVILIDTTSNYENKYLPRILNMSDEIVFLAVPTKCEFMKAFKLFKVFIKDFQIDKNKITLILNKTTNFEVDECVYRENLGNLEVKGRLRYNEQMELIMNKNDLDRRLVWLEN